MSRARNIKPGFFKNDVLAECAPLARILFCGLWCEADREGRLEDRPKRLKAECLPYDECDCDALLDELASRGFIVRYERDGSRYIAIPEFLKHQNPHCKEAASSIPAPYKHSASPVQAQDKTGSSRADSPSLIPPSPFQTPSASRGASASTPEDSQLPAGVDPERWASYRDQLADDGKLSISRIKTALMQLRRVSQAGHDPNAVLTAAVMRGLRDLDDCAARLAREKAPPVARAGPGHAPPQSRQLQAINVLNEVTEHVTQDRTTAARLADPGTAGRIAQAGLPEPGVATVR